MAKYKKGLYRAEITAQRFGVSEKSGTPYFEVDFRVTAFFDPATHEPAQCDSGNRSLRIYIKKGDGLPIALDRMKALGMEGNFSQYDPTKSQHVTLVGKEIKVWCKGPNDKGFDEWNVFVPSDKQRKPREADPHVAAKLDNLFAGKLGGTPALAPTVDVSDKPLPF